MRALLILLWTAGRALAAEPAGQAPAEILVRLSPAAAKIAAGQPLTPLDSRYGVFERQPLTPANPVARRARPAVAEPLDRWFRLRFSSGADPLEVARAYALQDLVEEAQPNYLRRPAASPDDSLFARQWNLQAIGWEALTAVDGGEVIVAVVDSGLDYLHPDLEGSVWTNAAEASGQEGVDDDGNGYVDDRIGWDFADAPDLPGVGDYLERDADPRDESGHGTHVSGIIAAVSGNRIGVAGVAPAARLMVLRAGFNLAAGSYLEDDDLAAAIVYAVDNGAQVINMSWGDPRFSPLIRDVVRYAAQAGCALVAAAGNEGNGQVFYPARLEETLAVAAIGEGGRIAAFSNFGASIDLAAPGQRILSLSPGGGYDERSGTSMAAAHISGLAALVLARNPQLGPAQVRGALVATALDLAPGGWDPFSGAGLARLEAVLVEEPPVAQLRAPRAGAVLSAGAVDVEMEAVGLDEYELSWGRGEEPGSWERLQTTFAEGRARAVWRTEGLAGGLYQLRARGEWQGHPLEDRIEVQLLHQAPQVLQTRLERVLSAGEWTFAAGWETEVPAAGQLRLEREGRTVYEVDVFPAEKAQQVLLPGGLEEGSYQVLVRPAAGALLGEEVLLGQVVVGVGEERWSLEAGPSWPEGYLMPVAVDFDFDGRPEVAQMGYGGLQYNTGDLYQLEGGGARRVHSASQLFIPWNARDLDGDGRLELMAVDARRVRLLEAASPGSFPDQVVWEQRDVWGGEVGDLDGDGRSEMYLRSARGSFFQVFESAADNRHEERAVLHNTSPGPNELGQRQVAADLDGDGKGDFLFGDGDGDLLAYEAVGDDAFRLAWNLEAEGDGEDARLVGCSADLDGDARAEFVVGRFRQDRFDLSRRSWTLSVYQAVGDNRYEEEWKVVVFGGQAAGNGVACGDVDGDGLPEWIVSLVPDLYVFTAAGPDSYALAWHRRHALTHTPLVADMDGNGRAELVFNLPGKVQRFALEEGLSSPGRLVAYALDEGHIALEWERVQGARGYRVWRDGALRADVLDPGFVDDEVRAGALYTYAVEALDGRRGRLSEVVEVRTGPSPEILEVERFSAFQLAVLFNAPMEDTFRRPHLFRVEPQIGRPLSALPDRGGRRIVLGFEQALPDSGRFTLVVEGLRARSGAPLSEAGRRTEFDLVPLAEAIRPLAAVALSPLRVELRFSGLVRMPPAAEGVFSFAPDTLHIHLVSVEGDRVVLHLEEETPLRPLGRRYWVRVSGLLDEEGRRVDGVLRFALAAAELAEVRVFPNPYWPSRGALTFGLLPNASRVRIFDAGGHPVRLLEERDGDGGVQWDGRNEEGQPVDSGIYLFSVEDGHSARRGKFALLRD